MNYIWKEWKESIRSKGLWLSLAIMIIVSLLMLSRSSGHGVEQGYYILIMNLFESLLYFIPILCLFLGAFSVFQEKEQKTLVMLLTKQESTFTFLFKKSIALQTVLIVPVFIWFFLYLVPLKFFFQVQLTDYGFLLATIIGLMLVFTQLGVLIGSYSRSRMQIAGIAVIIWFYFFFLHDFALLSVLPNITHDNVQLFSVAYFLNPIQTVRMFLESGLGIYSFGNMSRLLESFMWLTPSLFFLFNLLFWLILSFAGAVLFHRKEGFE
ncbi:ABC transporter permease [Mesobacillus maritimus]|uniref:ABC transporter permease n=1 Tax=Mesobacillus maritimus TaxID=1643336 RepID=UPI00203AA4A9|nr:ABC transporter permease subunit [Mesobacillus maritimus]MCM3586800.1 ABC transporter permease [Mesobacillus maritimus]MCM3668845.1 ABC transporter permease [Mesobacillus maritimus]